MIGCKFKSEAVFAIDAFRTLSGGDKISADDVMRLALSNSKRDVVGGEGEEMAIDTRRWHCFPQALGRLAACLYRIEYPTVVRDRKLVVLYEPTPQF